MLKVYSYQQRGSTEAVALALVWVTLVYPIIFLSKAAVFADA